MKAVWHKQVLASSDETIIVEGNHYFPAESINRQFFIDSETTTQCSWKGIAHYYSIIVGEDINVDAAWYYPEPKAAASDIRNHVAFWKGVEITEES